MPRFAVGIVIGRNGEMIKKIQNDAGVRIQFKPGLCENTEVCYFLFTMPSRDCQGLLFSASLQQLVFLLSYLVSLSNTNLDMTYHHLGSSCSFYRGFLLVACETGKRDWKEIVYTSFAKY